MHETCACRFPPETLEPDYPWHPHKPGIVWWAMDYMCATFDTVMSQQLDRFSGNLTPSDIMRDVFPIVNTGAGRAWRLCVHLRGHRAPSRIRTLHAWPAAPCMGTCTAAAAADADTAAMHN